MRLTFATDDQAYSVDVDADMELGDIMALLEAESDIPIPDQSIVLDGTALLDPKKTLRAYNVKDDDVLLLQNLRSPSTSNLQQGGPASNNQMASANNNIIDPSVEMARASLLSNPELLQRLREAEPEFADAAQNDPAKFQQLYNARRETERRMQDEKRHMEELLMADPFDVAAQQKIEELIRQEQVYENMEHAMEFSPESFGRVQMLYVNVQVNGHDVKAFVDSGAQATIISPDLAASCGIMRLLDTRFAGIARGVGTAKILGRIHSAQIRVGQDLFLPVAFTVMEGKGVDLLFGLDMLKRYQACIDLEKNCLRIQGRSVRFLDEHELPRNALEDDVETDANGNIKLPAEQASHGAALGAAASASNEAIGRSMANKSGGTQSFAGTGQTLGGTNTGASAQRDASRLPEESRWSEDKITALTGMGVPREEAIRLLDTADGNVDMAASLVFD